MQSHQLDTELGPITVTLTGGGHAFLRVDAHLNDDKPALEFKGEQWVGSLRAVLTDEGWQQHPDHNASWSSRTRSWSAETPRTYGQKITAAVLAALTEFATPVLLAQADEQATLRTVGLKEDNLRKAREALALAQSEYDEALAVHQAAWLNFALVADTVEA